MACIAIKDNISISVYFGGDFRIKNEKLEIWWQYLGYQITKSGFKKEIILKLQNFQQEVNIFCQKKYELSL